MLPLLGRRLSEPEQPQVPPRKAASAPRRVLCAVRERVSVSKRELSMLDLCRLRSRRCAGGAETVQSETGESEFIHRNSLVFPAIAPGTR